MLKDAGFAAATASDCAAEAGYATIIIVTIGRIFDAGTTRFVVLGSTPASIVLDASGASLVARRSLSSIAR